MDKNETTSSADQDPSFGRKYIRTFADDVALVKRGGGPIPPEPESSAPVEVSSTPPPPPKAPPETYREPIPPPPPPPEPEIVSPVAPLPELTKPNPVESYTSDFSDRMKKTKASTATILAAEQDSATGAPQADVLQKSSKSLVYAIVGVLFLSIGGVGIYVAYLYYQTSTAPVVLSPSVSAPIFVDEREEIKGSGSALLQAIEQSITRPIAQGSVRLLYTAPATTTDASVFSKLPLSAPSVLTRNVDASGSMAGIVIIDGVQSPFFILSVTSYSDTFSGLLSWEPLMARSLVDLFPPYATSSVAQVTSALSGFQDESISNHDVRIYRDAAGRSILLYGYWNQSTLVIARDPSVFIEILERLATARTKL